MPARQPATVPLVLAAAVALTGLVWLLQGLGVPIGGSFMVGDRTWAIVGAVMIVAAAAFAVREVRSSRR